MTASDYTTSHSSDLPFKDIFRKSESPYSIVIYLDFVYRLELNVALVLFECCNVNDLSYVHYY